MSSRKPTRLPTPSLDATSHALRTLEALEAAAEEAQAAADAAACASVNPDADTELGRLRGIAEGLRRAVAIAGSTPFDL